jgi:CheY-like chemotaxis protein
LLADEVETVYFGGGTPTLTEQRELVRLLAALAASAGGAGVEEKGAGLKSRAAWDKRRVMVCVSTSHRGDIARALTGEGYEVFVAEDTARAMGLLREDKVDVLLLDPEFDMAEQGTAFIMREVNALRPSERRRLVVVHLSPSARTEDAHAAFLSNVNLFVNTSDVAELPRALERTLRDLNELYKDLNKALGVAAI